MLRCFRGSGPTATPSLAPPLTMLPTTNNVVSSTYTINDNTDSTGAASSTNNVTTSSYSTANKAIIQFVSKTGLNTTATREIVDIFFREGFDSLTALKTLTSQDLKNMNIKNGHARVLLPAIAKLQDHMHRVDHALAKTPLPLKRNAAPTIGARLESWLKSLPGSMEIYGIDLARSGYDSLESVSLMEDEDLDAVIPEHKSGHRKVFRKAHARLKNRLMHDRGIDDLGRDLDKHRTSGQLVPTGKGKGSHQRFNTALSVASRRALGMDYDESNINIDDSDTPPPLPIDTPHLYVLSGRSRVPQHVSYTVIVFVAH